MQYFDSDVIFNYIVIQDPVKHEQANQLILEAIAQDQFVISTLVIQEVGYGLARFELKSDLIKYELDYLLSLNITSVHKAHLSRALQLSETIGFKHINDCLHAAVAESLNCDVFYTYNKSDFRRIQKVSPLDIIIL
ncbi:type II toxin-antitoxin system VapC family toxin [Dyadobacter fanqingshengii]|uniref:PIN domain-containing protein n=1 Tax=Dyadobacter fanqingshengii TaxID=2906443 RepID=A0A9X1TBD1_9BACT|nr:PIN domain-containing protein [Dyadobacter fanqingshengii]MCF0042438.1 PIN domain-containing protein [Dyadobacter fanqingshengii]USJ35038.1 PIN domain-containing protein [Dyadobacter fanqingshengii]